MTKRTAWLHRIYSIYQSSKNRGLFRDVCMVLSNNNVKYAHHKDFVFTISVSAAVETVTQSYVQRMNPSQHKIHSM